MPTPDQIKALQDLGPYALLVIGIVGLILEIVVPGRAHKRVLGERDAAYERVDRLTAILEGKTSK